MGTKAKKLVYRYENSKNMLNCISKKVKENKKVTTEDLKIPKTPYVAVGTTKEKRFKDLPFSILHNRLIESTYSKENRIVKQQTAEAKHEIVVQRIIAATKRAKFTKIQAQKAEMPYVVTIDRADSKGIPYVFSTNYSNKPLKVLKKIVDNLGQELYDKWGSKDFRGAYIYKKENMIPGLNTNLYEHAFHHYNATTKIAA